MRTVSIRRPACAAIAVALLACGSDRSSAAATFAPVALVRGTATEAQDPDGEGPAAARYASTVASALRRAGVPFTDITDEEAGGGGLTGALVAVLPYNPRYAPGELDALKSFVADGGRLVVFYAVDPSLRATLGIASWKLRTRSRRDEFASMVSADDAPRFMPPDVRQDSWVVVETAPSENAQVLAWWHDAQGRPVPPTLKSEGDRLVAIVSGPGGVFVSHILMGPVSEAKARLMLSLCAHLAGPAVFEPAARARLEEAREVSSWQGLGGLSELARAVGDPRADRSALLAHLGEAGRAEQRAVAALELGAYAEAYAQAGDASRQARLAAACALPARDGEIRAIWVRYPEHVDWPRTAKALADAGFNVVFPNYIRGMVAHMAVENAFSRPPDRADSTIETCIRSCRRAGIEVHLWWTVLFLDDTPGEAAAPLEREGRLVVLNDGSLYRKAGAGWLCPSNRQNRAQARALAAEVCRRFGPDGIHLDYVRLPLEASCYCDACRAGYARADNWPDDVLPGGEHALSYREYRRESVTGYVDQIAAGARETWPGVFMSAAVFPENPICRQTIAQDWVEWSARGIVDFIVPMNYTDRTDELDRWVRDQSHRLAGRIPLVAGLGVAAGRVGIEDPADLVRQIATSRAAGADGFAVFQLDDEFLRKHAPVLAAGPGRTGGSVRPHGAPLLHWQVEGGIAPDAMPAGYTVEVRLRVDTRLASGLGATDFSLARADGAQWPRVELESASGRLLTDLGPGPRPGSEVRIPVVVPAEPFRIVVRGRVTAPPRPTRLVAMRSVLFEGKTGADLRAERARTAPTGPGSRIAVLDGGYGSRGILAALRRSGAFAAYPVQSLETLARTDDRPAVLVLTQRRDPGELSGAARAAVRLFVEAGGSVVLTHDAVGYRYHPELFTRVVKGVGHERISSINVTGGILPGIEQDMAVSHAHYDHVILQAGPDGTVVADGTDGPVIVAGTSGQGRVIACGIAIGIDRDERERAPEGDEATLLAALVSLAAGQE